MLKPAVHTDNLYKYTHCLYQQRLQERGLPAVRHRQLGGFENTKHVDLMVMGCAIWQFSWHMSHPAACKDTLATRRRRLESAPECSPPVREPRSTSQHTRPDRMGLYRSPRTSHRHTAHLLRAAARERGSAAQQNI